GRSLSGEWLRGIDPLGGWNRILSARELQIQQRQGLRADVGTIGRNRGPIASLLPREHCSEGSSRTVVAKWRHHETGGAGTAHAVELVRALIGAEDEQLVLDHWSARCAAKLVFAQQRPRRTLP